MEQDEGLDWTPAPLARILCPLRAPEAPVSPLNPQGFSPTLPMKRSLATLFLGALCASLCSSCVTEGSKMNDHWSPTSMPARMQRTFTGYDVSRDGSFLEWLERDADSIGLTLQRHLLGFNPDNPLRNG